MINSSNGMHLFISYSTADESLVQELSDALAHRATISFWQGSLVPGDPAWGTIFGWIDSADLVLVVITDNAVSRGIPIGQEIGRAVAKRKTVIPLVAPGIDSTALGCLGGITYLPISQQDLPATIEKLHVALNRKVLLKEQQRIRGNWQFGIAMAALLLLSLVEVEE